jgi:hypothetical protein
MYIIGELTTVLLILKPNYYNCALPCYITATNRSAAQPNVVKENSADRHPVVQLTSPKTGTLGIIGRVKIKLDLISNIK